MSATSHVNVYSALAGSLANPRVLSQEERLFQQALRSVEDQRRKDGKLPKLFDNLSHARTIEDVQYMINHEKQNNDFWSKDV